MCDNLVVFFAVVFVPQSTVNSQGSFTEDASGNETTAAKPPLSAVVSCTTMLVFAYIRLSQ